MSCRVVFLIVLSLPLKSLADELPVPTAADLQKPLSLIKEVYGAEHSNAKTNEQLQDLAKKLLAVATTAEKPVERYALLRVARDIASEGCDCDLAFRIIEEIDQSFEIDAVTMKAGVLYAISKKVRLPEDRKYIAARALDLVNLTVSRDEFDTAGKLADVALSHARNLRDTDYLKTIAARRKEIEEFSKEYKELKAAIEKLEQNPADPEANLVAGRYYCLVKGDWENGLPLLALGSDEDLKNLAVQELGQVAKPEEQMELGDSWWDLAEAANGRTRQRLRERAAHWYRRAAPQLTGLAKARVEKQLSEVEASETTAHHVATGWEFKGVSSFSHDRGGLLLNHSQLPAELDAKYENGRGRVAGICRVDKKTIDGGIRGHFGKAFVWLVPSREMLDANFRLESRHLSQNVTGGPKIFLGIVTSKGTEIAVLGERVLHPAVTFALKYDPANSSVELTCRETQNSITAALPDASPVGVVVGVTVRYPGEQCDTTISGPMSAR